MQIALKFVPKLEGAIDIDNRSALILVIAEAK